MNSLPPRNTAVILGPHAWPGPDSATLAMTVLPPTRNVRRRPADRTAPAHVLLATAAALLPAGGALAAATPPPEAEAALRAGRAVDLIVEYEADQVDRAAKARRRLGDLHETSAILAFRAGNYGRIKDEAEAALPHAATPTLVDYSHLPMRLKRFQTLAALRAWASDARVKAIHIDGRAHRVLSYSLPLIQQPTAAASGYTGAGTTIAIIDDGIDYANAAFGGCTAPGAPASCKVAVSQLVGNATGSTSNSHGTNVSAVALGVAPGARVAMLNAFSGNSATFSAILAGINWAIANRATYNIVAINMSLGDGSKNTSACAANNPFATPVGNAVAAGIAVVAAAGNDAYTNALANPACTPNVVSVGAVYTTNWGGLTWGGSLCTDTTTAADKVACFSDSASFLTLLAPGALVTAAGIQSGGTSQASPHVAGAIAVLRAAFPAESMTAAVGRLTANGTAVSDPRNGLVKPRVNLPAAARPVNDDYAARAAVSGGSGSVTGSNILGTREAGEVPLAGGAGGRTIWWKWVAPAAGQVSIGSQGSGFGTTLAVYPAAAGIGTLGAAIATADGGSAGEANALFQAVAGSEYEFAVDANGGGQGPLTLNWSLNAAAAADLSVSLGGPSGAGGAYTALVANAGPQAATHVKLTLALPAGASFVGASVPCTATAAGIVCELGTLAAGSNVVVAISLDGASGSLGASIASDLGDPAAGNDSSTVALDGRAGSGEVPTLPEWALMALGTAMLAAIRRRLS